MVTRDAVRAYSLMMKLEERYCRSQCPVEEMDANIENLVKACQTCCIGKLITQAEQQWHQACVKDA